MKKIYFLLPLWALFSCGTADQDTSELDNPVLVTKMVQHGDNYTFSYTGTKIVEMRNTTDNWKRTFSYTGDLITKYVDLFADGTSQTTVLAYNSNEKITKKTTTFSAQPNSSDTTTYVYIGADQIKVTVTLASAGSTKTYNREVLINSNGSLKSWTETMTNVQGGVTTNGTGSLQAVVYDSGHYPFKNVTGYTKMLEKEDMSGSVRNVSKYKYTMQYGGTGSEYTIFQSSYEYNTNGYPKKDTRDFYNPTGGAISSEITTYEYNHL